jgi:DNA-binding XRE family transcriptional regulator
MENNEQNQQFTEEMEETVETVTGENKPKSNAGRPAWIPSEEELEKVVKLASQGMTQAQIADCLGIAYQTISGKKKEFPELDEAIKKGKALGISYVTNKLMAKVGAMDTTSILFYLKCQAGWKEASAMDEIAANGGKLELIINGGPPTDC